MKEYLKILIRFSMVVTLLSGCAQNQSITAGDDYVKAGKFQLAAEAYAHARLQEPEDKELYLKSLHADKMYHKSLDVLMAEATALEQQNKLAAAMFLYGKVASANYMVSSNAARIRYDAIKAQLLAKNIYKLKAKYDKNIFGDGFLKHKKNVELVGSIDKSQPNELSLSMKLSAPEFTVDSTTEVGTGQYVSGKKQITNPQYTAQQQKVTQKERDLEGRQAWMDKLTSRSQNVVDLAEAESAFRQAVAANAPQAKIAEAKKAYDKQVKRRQNIFNDLATAREDYRNITSALNYERQVLIVTPTLVWVDDFATHTYPILVRTQHVNATLSYEDSNGNKRTLPIHASFVNRSYAAQPIIKVSAAAQFEVREDEMVDKLHVATQAKGEAVVDEYIAAYRAGILVNADKATDQSEKVKYWILYGIAGTPNDISQTVSTQVTSYFNASYGDAAHFDMSKILFL